MASDRIVLDSGALSALAEESEAFRVALRKTLRRRAKVVVPTAVIVEATTGDYRRDANVNRALKETTLMPLDSGLARSAAALRYAHRRAGAGTIDAIVVASADLVPGSGVLTSDPTDLTLLANVKGCTRVIALSDARTALAK
ncbi:MAG TPA: PIN domain-containing protein [Candidatus Elarobacter sp.]|nr:PIN domain-containing protein [Candidatus Elarobacter sp.]